MTLFDYIKVACRNLLTIIIVVAICMTGAYLYSTNANAKPYQSTLFLSFSIQDKNAASATSTYENLEAADQITESIQGWFKDPGFINQINQSSNLNFPIQAKKQEKNNLLLTFNSSDELSSQKYSDQIVALLNQRLAQYNSKSDLQINTATSTLHNDLTSSKTSLYLLIALAIGLIMGYLGAFGWELLNRVIQSKTQLESLSGKKLLASYSNEKQLNKNNQFLSKYLSHKYSGSSLQVVNLTHKDQLGADILSNNSGIKSVKNIKLPDNFSDLSIELPTLLIIEIGHSKTQLIQELNKLGISNLEIISLR